MQQAHIQTHTHIQAHTAAEKYRQIDWRQRERTALHEYKWMGKEN